MKIHSYIFNSDSKKVFLYIGIFIFSTFFFDRAFFLPMFYSYSLAHGGMGIEKPADIFVIGSSHLEQAVDIHTLQKETGLKVSTFTIPTSDLKRKYYVIKERLENKNLPPPKIIILETSKLTLNNKRYRSVLLTLLPYYHMGILREYMDLSLACDTKQRLLNKIFHSYAFNRVFPQTVFDPALIIHTFLENYGSESLIEKGRKIAGKLQKIPADTPNKTDTRIDVWRKIAEEHVFSNEPDPNLLQYLYKIVDLVKNSNTQLLLLEPPFFRFPEEEKDDGFEKIRSILKSTEGKKIKYALLDTHNYSEIFADVSHLDPRYRVYYTKILSDYLRNNKLL